jgi:hypothetical protein
MFQKASSSAWTRRASRLRSDSATAPRYEPQAPKLAICANVRPAASPVKNAAARAHAKRPSALMDCGA